MIFVVDPTGYNWLAQAFDDMFADAAKTHGFNRTQKEQAQLQGYRDGLAVGLAKALTAVGTEQRILRIKTLVGTHRENVQMVDHMQVESWVKKELKALLEGDRRRDDESWKQYLAEVFAEIVWPDELVQQYAEVRKEKILKGEIEPEAGDAAWLEEHMRTVLPQYEKIQELMAKAQGRKK